jgi:hypothetical protein
MRSKTPQEIVAPPAGEFPEVINLMEALKESVARVQPAAKKETTKSARKAGSSRRAAPARQISGERVVLRYARVVTMNRRLAWVTCKRPPGRPVGRGCGPRFATASRTAPIPFTKG